MRKTKMIKDLRTNNKLISNYIKECIAHMDDKLREQIASDYEPCTNEVFIAEYVSRLSKEKYICIKDFLADEFNLDLDDIIYTAYCERYQGKVVDAYDIEWLLESREVLKVTNKGLSSTHPRMTEYTVMMISGDIDVYSYCFM